MVFVDLFEGEGGSTAAAVTLDTVADESGRIMADGVARSPSRLCSRGREISCSIETRWVRFSRLLAFVPCFLFFVYLFAFVYFIIFPLHPGMFIFFVSLRLCSSDLLL